MSYQEEVERGQQKHIGVNAFVHEDDDQVGIAAPERLSVERISAYLHDLENYKADRNKQETEKSLQAFQDSFTIEGENTFEKVVAAIEAGATHGEICHAAREAVGDGQPLNDF